MYSVKKDNIEHYTRHDITNCEQNKQLKHIPNTSYIYYFCDIPTSNYNTNKYGTNSDQLRM